MWPAASDGGLQGEAAVAAGMQLAMLEPRGLDSYE